MHRTDSDSYYMQQALALAARGRFTTTPNPHVGCVIVKEGLVVGEGWHRKAGEAHAEVLALADARSRGADVRGATLYVTLEPCCHHGRTPPCTEAIIAAGIARVVAACADPNPLAAHGSQVLQAAGIAFESGVLEQEAQALNCGFISRMKRGRPWVRSKVAASLDGRTALADGRSQWITGSTARDDGHYFRACACAVLTGIGTVLADDPMLNVRAVATERQPLRIVLDRSVRIPSQSHLMRDGGDTLVVTSGLRPAGWPAHVQHLHLPSTGLNGAYGTEDIKALMQMLATRGLNELHVEAGARLNGALLDADVLDELLVYLSPKILGDDARAMFDLAAPLATLDAYDRFLFHDVAQVGDDVRLRLWRKES